MNIDRIKKWQHQSSMFKIIDRARKNIILVNSEILNTLSPIIKTPYSEYFLNDYEILSETSESMMLKNIHNETQILIKRA